MLFLIIFPFFFLPIPSNSIEINTQDESYGVLILALNQINLDLGQLIINNGPAGNYTMVEIGASSNVTTNLQTYNFTRFHTIFLILSEYSDTFSDAMVSQFEDKISTGTSIAVISSKIWKMSTRFHTLLGIETPIEQREVLPQPPNQINLTVRNNDFFYQSNNYSSGREITTSAHIGVINNITLNTTLILETEDLNPSPLITIKSGIYLRKSSLQSGYLLTIPLNLQQSNETDITNIIISLSNFVINWSTEHSQSTTTTIVDPSFNPNNIFKSIAPSEIFLGAVGITGVVATSVIIYKTLSTTKILRKRNEIDLEKPELSSDKESPWILFILSPIFGIFSAIIYSNKFKRLTKFQIEDNDSRKEILLILDRNEFEHFNSLKKKLNIGVSSLQWHLQVLKEFGLITQGKIGQYNLIFISESSPQPERVALYFSMRKHKAILIVNYFLKGNSWSIRVLSNSLSLGKDIVRYYCAKLVELGILTYNENTRMYSLLPDKRPLLVWLKQKNQYMTNIQM